MARISTYEKDLNINPDDKWIGTDADFLDATKNFTAGAVATWIAQFNYVDNPFPRYTYKDMTIPANIAAGRECGTISQDPAVAGVIPFSTLTNFMLSIYQKNRCTVDISGYYTAPLVGSTVIITKCTDMSTWGIFTWVSAQVDPIETSFFDIQVTYIAGNGGFENDQDSFNVNHGLNKFSSVTIVDPNEEIVEAHVDYTSANSVTITFSEVVNNYKAFFN